jgi:hypothetical protein
MLRVLAFRHGIYTSQQAAAHDRINIERQDFSRKKQPFERVSKTERLNCQLSGRSAA